MRQDAELSCRCGGLYQFYASCCRTPLGNTVGPAIPFVGIVARAFEGADLAFGKPIGAILGQYAIGEPPEGSTGLNIRGPHPVARHG
jgi:hypothetical protein